MKKQAICPKSKTCDYEKTFGYPCEHQKKHKWESFCNDTCYHNPQSGVCIEYKKEKERKIMKFTNRDSGGRFCSKSGVVQEMPRYIKDGRIVPVEYMFVLPTTIEQAKIKLEPMGQESAHYSDRVIVKATLFLPTFGTLRDLAECIQFGNRVTICDSWLWHNWGYLEDGKSHYRYKDKIFKGINYMELYKEGYNYMKKELENLIKALKIREDIRLKAERV